MKSKQLVTAVEESLAPEMARPFKQAQINKLYVNIVIISFLLFSLIFKGVGGAKFGNYDYFASFSIDANDSIVETNVFAIFSSTHMSFSLSREKLKS